MELLVISKIVSLFLSPSLSGLFFFFLSLFVSLSPALREAQNSLTCGRTHSNEGTKFEAELRVKLCSSTL